MRKYIQYLLVEIEVGQSGTIDPGPGDAEGATFPDIGDWDRYRKLRSRIGRMWSRPKHQTGATTRVIRVTELGDGRSRVVSGDA